MEFFDSHAHYNDEKFENDRVEILNKLYNEENITRLTCVGYNLEKSKFALKIAKENDFIYATARYFAK
ncbi:MAG: TatD family hydrolase [Clostridia bacterium]